MESFSRMPKKNDKGHGKAILLDNNHVKAKKNESVLHCSRWISPVQTESKINGSCFAQERVFVPLSELYGEGYTFESCLCRTDSFL